MCRKTSCKAISSHRFLNPDQRAFIETFRNGHHINPGIVRVIVREFGQKYPGKKVSEKAVKTLLTRKQIAQSGHGPRTKRRSIARLAAIVR